MSEPGKTRKWEYALVIAALFAVFVVVVVPFVLLELLSTGWMDGYLRGAVTGQIARTTGGSVELRGFHLNPWQLMVTLDDLTIHGHEPAGSQPFFHVDRLAVQVRVDSLWRRKVSLGDVEILRPAVHVQIERDGSSNVPAPRPSAPPSAKPLRQAIFDVVARRLRLEDGTMVFNDRAMPLVAEGGNFELAVDYSDAPSPMYLGNFRWQQVRTTVQRFATFPSDVMARFTLQPDSFVVTQLLVSLPHTTVDAQISLPSFTRPEWSFKYRGHMDLVDLRTLFRNPGVPSGHTDFVGNGRIAGGQLKLDGGYTAQQIGFRFQWFHTVGITSRGSYQADRNILDVPDFQARIMGGVVSGTVHLDFKGLHFRADTHSQSIDLATLLASVDNESMPVVPLHWNGTAEIQNITTWNGGFQHVDTQGVMLWAPPAPGALPAGGIPATARLAYHYSMATNSVSLGSSEITTPGSSVRFNGVLGPGNSALEMTYDSQDITPWDDFINRIRGKDARPEVITGSFHWQGQLTGPLVGPTFAGHVKGTNARYDRLYWDEIEGDMRYGPDGFQFTHASARRGTSSAQLELSLTLDNWDFAPDSPWSVDATLIRTETSGLQSLLGFSVPIGGLLSGDFHGTGTRAEPQIHGLFDFVSPVVWGWRFDRARGQFSLDQREMRISNAELRLLPPPASGGSQTAVPGLVTGNFRFGWADRQTEFNLTGAVLPLESISQIQMARLPIGGQLSFQLSGQGPLLAPKLTGSLRLVDLRLGSEVEGSFAGQLDSDGNRMTLQLDSAIATGALHGHAEVALSGVYPITAQVGVTDLNLNPLISSALHLSALTAPSRVDGNFTLDGALLQPDTMVVKADLSRIALDYGNVSLENTSPVQFEYRSNEVRVSQANFRGPESDFHVGGMARFAGDRQLNLQLSGAVNLRLLGTFVPHLDAQGPAQVDAAISGTIANPRVTGRAHLQAASLRYGDFPAGLSNVAGDFVFDTTRLVFENVAAEIGGGKVVLGGALSYSGPVRYDVTASLDQVRIRYPAGMSWHADGSLHLTGSPQAAALSGRVTVDRLLLSDAFDVAALMTSQESVAASSNTSEFLRNLELDVQASTTPNAVLQWPSGRFQADANVRLRGTWDSPIVLGNIHMLAGDMEFRGNRYQLTRGDINFSNPFRIDPVLNIEATTQILEYQIAVSFTGAASHPTMSYRSEPPLPSSDVITLLALGQTGEESALRGVNSSQTPELGATTLLSEAVSSQLGGRIQRLFGISHFSVDPFLAGTTTTTQNSAARVTVEQRFSSDLTVTYITNVTSTEQQVIQIEYLLRPDISVIALRDENGTFGMDVIFRKRFK